MKEAPEIVRAPLVVKVPDTLGKFEKSNVAVMVTGMGVEADAEGAEPIVKKAIIHSVIAAEKTLLCRIISILFFVNCWFEVMFTFPLQRDSGGRAARNRDFSRSLCFSSNFASPRRCSRSRRLSTG